MEDIGIRPTIEYTPGEVHDLMKREPVVLCDVRDAECYGKGHIPGAVNVPEVFHYLTESTPHGLHKMYEQLRDIFASSGIHDNSHVIFYEDQLNTQFGSSCRGYMFLSILGHTLAGILTGGFEQWLAEGLPIEKKGTSPRPSTHTPRYNPEYIATKVDVLAAIDNPDITLLDNRDKP